MDHHKVSLVLLLSLFLCPVVLAQNDTLGTYLHHFCGDGIFTSASNYQINLNILLFREFYDNSAYNYFYNATTGEEPDQVHGHLLCRGDISGADCKSCVDKAAQEVLIRRCRRRKNAMIWFNGCFIRYANRSFTSTLVTEPAQYIWSEKNVSESSDAFDLAVTAMLRNLTDVVVVATSNTSKPKYYAASEAQFSKLVTLYGYVQCTADISIADCITCLEKPIDSMFEKFKGKEGLRYLSPSCDLRYDIHPFATSRNLK